MESEQLSAFSLQLSTDSADAGVAYREDTAGMSGSIHGLFSSYMKRDFNLFMNEIRDVVFPYRLPIC